MAKLKDVVGPSLPTLYNFTYADSAARAAATGLVSADIGKMARQSDTGNFYQLKNHSPVTWIQVGGGSGQGGINYITNPNAEDDVSGWTLYADAADVAPVDGVGGSAIGVSISRVTSNPLRGTAMFVLGKDTFSEQGKGVATPFTIDQADRNKTLSVSFNYRLSNSAVVVGSASDIRVYVYDITNSKLIYPDSHLLSEGPNGDHEYRATWDSSDSVSYRLILHFATTTTNGFSINFDNVQVGPMPAMFAGSPELSLRYNSSANTSVPTSTVTIIDYNNATFDKSNGSVTTGASWKFTAQENGRYFLEVKALLQANASAHNVTLFLYKNGVEYSQLYNLTQNVNIETDCIGSDLIDLVAGDYIDIRISQDSGSTLTISSNANRNHISIEKLPTAMPIAQGEISTRYHSSTVQTLSGTPSQLFFENRDYDSTSGITNPGTAWRFTAQQTGRYRVSAGFGMSGPSQFGFTLLYKNGSLYSQMNATYLSSGGLIFQVSGTDTVSLAAGEYVEIWAKAGVNTSGIASETYVSIEKIPSASVQANVPRSQVVAYNIPGTPYGSSSTKIRRFGTSDVMGSDITFTDSASLGSSFTVNSPGVYSLSYTDAGGGGAYMGFSLNTTNPTTSIKTLSYPEMVIQTENQGDGDGLGSIATTLFLSAGDVIRAHTDGTIATTNASYLIFRIVKVSN